MSFTHFTLDIDGDGLALVTWNSPGRSMNVIDPAVKDELAAIVEQVAADAAIKGVVITSGKESFCAGADLTMLESMSRAHAELVASQGESAANQHVFEESRKTSLLYRRIETCGKPWVAAINGIAVGGDAMMATTRPASVCRKSKSACSPAPAARSGWRASCRRPMRCSFCSRATRFRPIAPKP